MLSAFEQAGLFCDIYLTCEDARTAMTMAGRAWHCLLACLHTLAAFPSIKGLRHHGRRPYNGNPARLAQRAPSIRASGFFKNVE